MGRVDQEDRLRHGAHPEGGQREGLLREALRHLSRARSPASEPCSFHARTLHAPCHPSWHVRGTGRLASVRHKYLSWVTLLKRRQRGGASPSARLLAAVTAAGTPLRLPWQLCKG